MRNEQVGQSKLLLEISQQIDDLRLDRDVQRGDRFVCNNKFWFKRQRPRDTDSLPLSAAELVRIPVHHGGIQAHNIQKVGDPVLALQAAGQAVNRKGLSADRTYCPAGITLWVELL